MAAFLLDNKNEVLSMEWFRDGHYHVEIKGEFNQEIIKEVLENSSTRIFETKEFNVDINVLGLRELASFGLFPVKKAMT